ncbi:MAG: hypothetical protein IJ806_02225 [Ruminococcus sp.]|nr:hypothetical protein [Ruminococcus sp.]
MKMKNYIVTLGDSWGSIRVYRICTATRAEACHLGIEKAKAEEYGDWYVSSCREV